MLSVLGKIFGVMASFFAKWQGATLADADAKRAQVEKDAANWRGAYADLQVRHAQTLAELQAARDERSELQRQLDAFADVIEQQKQELDETKREIRSMSGADALRLDVLGANKTA